MWWILQKKRNEKLKLKSKHRSPSSLRNKENNTTCHQNCNCMHFSASSPTSFNKGTNL